MDAQKFDKLAKWVSQNVGEKFYLYPPRPGDPKRYEEKPGVFKAYKVHGANPEKLKEALKHYIDQTIGLDLPQVEFSNDWRYFKIYYV